MKKRNKFLAGCLTAVMLLAMPGAIGAAQAVGVPAVPAVVIGTPDGTGVELNETTPYYVNGEAQAVGDAPAAWNAYFDVDNKTLYLDGLKAEGYYQYNSQYFRTAGLYSNGDLTISLSGRSTIQSTARGSGKNTESFYGIQLWNNTTYHLTVTSENGGSLAIKSGEGSGGPNSGINCKDMTINGSADVTAMAGESVGNTSYGVKATKLTVTDEASLMASAWDGKIESMGIHHDNADMDLTISGSARVIARGGRSETGTSAGIYAGGLISVSGSAVVGGYGDSGNAKSLGIYSRLKNIKIADDASVYGKGGEARQPVNALYDGSFGVYLADQTEIMMDGGLLAAAGNKQALFGGIDLTGYTGGYSAVAGAEEDGSNSEKYDPAKNSSYRYLNVEPYIHQHQWNTSEWSGSETHHWHECAEENCTVTDNSQKNGYGAHIEDDGVETKPATETEDGIKTYSCTVCGAELRTEPIPMTGTPHTHSFGTEWKTDDKNHWKECACGETADLAAHTEDDGVVTTPATDDKDGVKTYSCKVCGKALRTEVIPAAGAGTEEPSKPSEIPTTGEAGGLWPYAALLLISGAGLAAVLYKRKSAVK